MLPSPPPSPPQLPSCRLRWPTGRCLGRFVNQCGLERFTTWQRVKLEVTISRRGERGGARAGMEGFQTGEDAGQAGRWGGNGREPTLREA